MLNQTYNITAIIKMISVDILQQGKKSMYAESLCFVFWKSTSSPPPHPVAGILQPHRSIYAEMVSVGTPALSLKTGTGLIWRLGGGLLPKLRLASCESPIRQTAHSGLCGAWRECQNPLPALHPWGSLVCLPECLKLSRTQPTIPRVNAVNTRTRGLSPSWVPVTFNPSWLSPNKGTQRVMHSVASCPLLDAGRLSHKGSPWISLIPHPQKGLSIQMRWPAPVCYRPLSSSPTSLSLDASCATFWTCISLRHKGEPCLPPPFFQGQFKGLCLFTGPL